MHCDSFDAAKISIACLHQRSATQMPPKASDEALADAVIQNVEFGAYPDSEDVISADLPASALPRLLDTIQKARDEVTV